jgi:hypothetical protein
LLAVFIAKMRGICDTKSWPLGQPKGGAVRAFLIVLGFVALSFSASFSRAQNSSSASVPSEGQSKTSIKEVLKNRQFEENQEITDAKLKADSGSLSKYSVKFNLSYYGPMVGEPLAKDQPNPDNSISPKETALKGSVGLRYRLDPKTALSAGTGISSIYPLHGMKRFDVQNPYFSYDLSNRLADIQLRNSIGFSAITVPNYTAVGEIASLDYTFSSVYDLGASRVAIGTDAAAQYFVYNRGYEARDRKANRTYLALYPMIKYNFSDKWNLNTSLALSWVNYRMDGDQSILIPQAITQRTGVGYAYSRYVYIFPYLNSYPDHFTWETTTVNLSTVFSVL